MSVLIKGIELPEKVQVLELHPDGKVFTRKGYLVGEAVELPDHHGRLVDADALIEQMEADAEHMDEPYVKMMYCAAISDVRHAPTIVEAEDES